jgi:hypothetical protein
MGGVVKDSYIAFKAPATGTYYVGISGELESNGTTSRGNRTYDPRVVGSGIAATTGKYRLQLQAEEPLVPYLYVSDAMVQEGQNSLQLKVSLNKPITETVVASFTTLSQTATADQDFVSATGSLTFKPGETEKFVDLQITNDRLVNEHFRENFQVIVTKATGIVIGDPVGLVEIINDDFERGDREGDYIGHARTIALQPNQILQLEGNIGDGVHQDKDVDLFRAQLAAGQVLHIDVDAYRSDYGVQLSSLDPFLRIFDNTGKQLVANSVGIYANDFPSDAIVKDSYVSFEAPAAGTYYFGISGELATPSGLQGNYKYDPSLPGSGDASTTGKYHVQFVSSLPISGDMDGDGFLTNPSQVFLLTSKFTCREIDKSTRLLTFTGNIVGDASSIEIDFNLDGTADYSANLNENGTFSVTFPEPTGGLTQIGYAFVRSDCSSTPWKTIDVDVPGLLSGDNTLQGVSLAIQRVVGEPQIAALGMESVRGTITGDHTFDTVTLEIDYDGDKFADKFINVTGSSTFDLQLFANAIGSKGQARLSMLNYSTGDEPKTNWFSIEKVVVESSGSSGNSSVGPGMALGSVNFFGQLSGSNSANSAANSSLINAILKATPTEQSPTITFASTVSSQGNGRLTILGNVNDSMFGNYVTAYRKSGDTLIELGSSTLTESGKTLFRVTASGLLSNGQEVIVHQHSGNGQIGSVSKYYAIKQSSDDDKDGISEAMELVGGGDSNKDGILDSKQSSVATLIESATGTLTTLDARGAKLIGVSNDLPKNSVDAIFVPQGLYSFEIHNVVMGKIHVIDVYLADQGNNFTTWLKLDPKSGELKDFSFDGETGAVKTTFGFSLYLKDGGRGDDDGKANGIIVDPSGPSFGINSSVDIGYWPDAPKLHNVTVKELPGKPDGLVWDTGVGDTNVTIPDSIKAQMEKVTNAYLEAMNANRKTYEETVARSEKGFELSKDELNQRRQNSIDDAMETYNSTIKGFVPPELAGHRAAVLNAQTNYRVAYDKRIKEIRDKETEDKKPILQTLHLKNAEAERIFTQEKQAISSSSYSSSRSGMPSGGNDRDARMIAAQQKRDNALIENAKVASIAMADLAKRTADDIADAAKREYQLLLDATDALQQAVVDGNYAEKEVFLSAYDTLQKELAAIDARFANSMAERRHLHDRQLSDARKTRAKADNQASTEHGKGIARLFYQAVVANEGDSTSKISTFRKAVASALLDRQLAELDAAKEARDAYIEADGSFDDSLAGAIAEETKSQASAMEAYKNQLISASTGFTDSVNDEKKDDTKTAITDETVATKSIDENKREYDKGIASVNKERTTRYATELESIRKAQSLNHTKFMYNQITEPQFLSIKEDLEKQAAEIQLAITKETFGEAPAIDNDGNLSDPGTDKAVTEARVKMQQFVGNAKVTRNKADSSANRTMDFASSTLDWTHTYEADTQEASDQRNAKNEEAHESAEKTVGEAVEVWNSAIATAEAAFASKTASATSTYSIAVAKAVVDYHIGLAQDRHDAIKKYSDGDPSNIWAKQQLSLAAAELTSTQSLGTAYKTMVEATAPAFATYISSSAQQEAEFTKSEMEASVAFQTAVLDSQNTFLEEKRKLEEAATASRLAAIKVFDDAVNQANKTQRTLHDKATAVHRTKLNAIAWNVLFKQLNPFTDVRKYKRDAEADAGSEYAHTILQADTTHRNAIANAREARSASFATLSKAMVQGLINARKEHEHRVADAAKSYRVKVAEELKLCEQTVSDYRFTHQETNIAADKTFATAVATANAEFTKSISKANAQFEKDLGSLKLKEIRAWAGDGISDPITRYEQFVIDAYEAQTTWDNSTADTLAANKIENAEATKVLQSSTFSSTATAQLKKAEAAKTLDKEFSGFQYELAVSTATAVNTEAKGRADDVATAEFSGAGENASLGTDIVSKIGEYRNETVNASAKAVRGIIAAEDFYHRSLLRDNSIRESAIQIVGIARKLDLASANNNFAQSVATEIDSWGSSFSLAFEIRAQQESEKEKTYIESIVQAYNSSDSSENQSATRYRDAIRSADIEMAASTQLAWQVFTASTGTSYTTAIDGMTSADKVYADHIAKAVSTHHIGVQSDIVTQLEHDLGSHYDSFQLGALHNAQAQLEYLRGYAPHYEAYVSASALNESNLRKAIAAAEVASDNSRESALTTFVAAAGAAKSEVGKAADADRLQFFNSITVASGDHFTSNATANKTWVDAMATTNKTFYTNRLKAETNHFREQARQSLARAQQNAGLTPSVPVSNEYLVQYIKDVVNADHDQAVGSIKADAARAATLIKANKTYIDSAADAQSKITSQWANHAQSISDKIADADYTYNVEIADAEKVLSKAMAEAYYTYYVQSAKDFSEATVQHFATVKTVILSFAIAGSSSGLAQIATAVSDDAWARKLAPEYVTKETREADGIRTYVLETTDSLRTAKVSLFEAVRAFRKASHKNSATTKSSKAGSDAQAIKANAQAVNDYEIAVNSANEAYFITVADLRRDARIAAGTLSIIDPDPTKLSEAEKAKQEALKKAAIAKDKAIATALELFFTQSIDTTKQSAIDSAAASETYELSAASAFKTLEHAMNDADSKHRKSTISANANFEIAKVDAEITRLATLYQQNPNATTKADHDKAVASRDQDIAKINTDRDAAIQAVTVSHTEKTAEINKAYDDAVNNANSKKAEAEKKANAAHEESKKKGPENLVLPSMEAPGQFGSTVSTHISLPLNVNDTLFALSFGDSVSALEVSFGGGFEESTFWDFIATLPANLFERISADPSAHDEETLSACGDTIQAVIDNPRAVGHLALDALGFIPVVGAFADVANAVWYGIEGNWKDALMSGLSAVPGIGDAAAAFKTGAAACKWSRLARQAEFGVNMLQSGVGFAEGAYAAYSDPTSMGGYFQMATNAIGMGISTRSASKGFGGCFDAGTLVHIPLAHGSLHDTVWSDEEFSESELEHSVRVNSSVRNLSRPSGRDHDRDWETSLAVALPTLATMTQPIETIRLGQRVIGENPQLSDIDRLVAEPVQEEMCVIKATALRANGSVVDIEILRPTRDVQNLGIEVGAQIALDLIELQVDGSAVVTDISDSPAIQTGEGHVVTGRFVTRFAENRVCVQLADGTELITTDTHPIWAPEFQTWIPAGELEPGYLLDTLDSYTEVVRVLRLNNGAQVYNLEIHDQHVYRVASNGVLVHNSDIECVANVDTPSKRRSLREIFLGSTPRKGSRTGQEVIERMRAEGSIIGEKGSELVRHVDSNGTVSWHPISDCDMGHRYDAVKYWNVLGRYLGPKHPAIREWMLTADNYVLQPKSYNRSMGAKNGMRYLPPIEE